VLVIVTSFAGLIWAGRACAGIRASEELPFPSSVPATTSAARRSLVYVTSRLMPHHWRRHALLVLLPLLTIVQ
jgi:hypothetical protein